MTELFNHDETLVRCPHCSAIASLGDSVCPECGQPLRMTQNALTGPLTRTPSGLILRHRDTAPLSPEQIVLLQVLPSGACLKLTDQSSIMLGRPASPTDSYLDLTPFNAARQGVSRRHCRLDRRNGHLYLIDLNSTNGTYLNGEQIEPGLAYPVADGDQIILGLLYLKLFFSQPATEPPSATSDSNPSTRYTD